MNTSTIAVIGSGFSGTLLSLHLLRWCPPHARIVLIERNRQFGRGMAYSTSNPSHLLNVPVGRMSAFYDRPNDFLDWLKGQPMEGREDVQPSAGSFVSRRLYGDYIRHLLNVELKRREPRDRLRLVRGDVLSFDRSSERLQITTDQGETVAADLAVLAIGNFPPAPPPIEDPSFYDSSLYHSDPWAPDALRMLNPEDPILMIGTGLTMVDAMISLLDMGHVGPIHVLSRRGLLPQRHAPLGGDNPHEIGPYPTNVRKLARQLRIQVARATAAGGNWRAVIDGLRPFTQDLWQCMSLVERARFLRHLRTWWDVSRHRMAGPVAEKLEAVQASGQLLVHRGRLQSCRIVGDRAEVTYCPRGTDRRETVRVARVINCSGPFADFTRIPHPLIRSLLDTGVARPDPLRLGLDVTLNCALLNAEGAISRRIFAVGPVTKSAFWEITAVPDIRRQCELLAHHLAALVKPPVQSSSQRQSAAA